MHFWGCFDCSKDAFISEFTEYFIENFIWFSNSQTPMNFRIRPLSQVTLMLVYDRCRSTKGSNSFHRFILQTINTMQFEQTRYCILMRYLPRCLAYINFWQDYSFLDLEIIGKRPCMFAIISRTWSVTNKNIQFWLTKSYMAKRKEMLIYATYFFFVSKNIKPNTRSTKEMKTRARVYVCHRSN